MERKWLCTEYKEDERREGESSRRDVSCGLDTNTEWNNRMRNNGHGDEGERG